MKKCIIAMVCLFLLLGCTVFKPAKLEPNATYVLTADSQKTHVLPAYTKKPISSTLLVAVPKAAAGYDSPRMVYQDRPYELSYFSKNRWADNPARMLMPLFVQTLLATRHFQAVVSAPHIGDTELRLDTELFSLYQDFTKTPSQVRMVILAQIVNVKTQHVLATHQFVFSEPAPHDDPYGGVIAANRIIAKLLPQLSNFSIMATRHIK